MGRKDSSRPKPRMKVQTPTGTDQRKKGQQERNRNIPESFGLSPVSTGSSNLLSTSSKRRSAVQKETVIAITDPSHRPSRPTPNQTICASTRARPGVFRPANPRASDFAKNVIGVPCPPYLPPGANPKKKALASATIFQKGAAGTAGGMDQNRYGHVPGSQSAHRKSPMCMAAST